MDKGFDASKFIPDSLQFPDQAKRRLRTFLRVTESGELHANLDIINPVKDYLWQEQEGRRWLGQDCTGIRPIIASNPENSAEVRIGSENSHIDLEPIKLALAFCCREETTNQDGEAIFGLPYIDKWSIDNGVTRVKVLKMSKNQVNSVRSYLAEQVLSE